VTDPFLAVTAVRLRQIGAGNVKPDLLFGHWQLRHVDMHRILQENRCQGNRPSRHH
jgi:hypothetical protein